MHIIWKLYLLHLASRIILLSVMVCDFVIGLCMFALLCYVEQGDVATRVCFMCLKLTPYVVIT